MPRLVMVLSADALTHASVFCRGKARAFIAPPKIDHQPAFKKLNGTDLGTDSGNFKL